jgi:hypothetical protein
MIFNLIKIEHQGETYGAVARYDPECDLLTIGTPDGLHTATQLGGSDLEGLATTLLWELIVGPRTGIACHQGITTIEIPVCKKVGKAPA